MYKVPVKMMKHLFPPLFFTSEKFVYDLLNLFIINEIEIFFYLVRFLGLYSSLYISFLCHGSP